MGRVTSATLTRNGGLAEHLEGASWADADGGAGQIELHYAYGPELLPQNAPSKDGMWRYKSLLPIGEEEIRYPLAIGDTPLIAPPRLRKTTGMPRLWLKDETRTPTGSNKDRATALILEHMRRHGVSTVSCASTGNVAVSLSAGAAASGVEAVIFVPAEVSQTKLTLMLLAGAKVLKVEEGYEAAFELSRRAARTFGWYDRNTGINPFTLEAKKTVAFEIWEQLGRRVPDTIVVPVGDGPTLTAMVKGFRELMACGATDRLPKVIGVQAEGCEPLARAWRTGEPVETVLPETIADGIAVGSPVSAQLVLRDVRETGGGFVSVSDEAMLGAIGELASKSGTLAEPAGAAAFAALEAARAASLVDSDEETVVHITGSGLKNPQYLRPKNNALAVRADLSEVERALSGR